MKGLPALTRSSGVNENSPCIREVIMVTYILMLPLSIKHIVLIKENNKDRFPAVRQSRLDTAFREHTD